MFRERREKLGLTLQEVAERSGTTRSYLSRLEANEREPSLSVAAGLAQTLGISLDEVASRPPDRIARVEGLLREALAQLASLRKPDP